VYPFGEAPQVIYEPPPPRHTGRYLLVALLVLVVLGGAALTVFLLRGVDSQGRAASVPSAPAPPPSPAPSPLTSASPSPSPSPPGDPNLVAQEDFTGTALDTSRWSVYNSTSPNGSTWSAGMVTVAGGELRIAGVGRNPTGAGNASGGLCWCGTGGDRVYGVWQVRARFEAGAGYGPVIGLWPKSGNDSADGAIGFADCRAPGRGTLTGYLVGPAGNPRFFQRWLTGTFTAWHTYTVEWRATYVRMYVDGKKYYDSTAQPGVVPPRAPLHLYLQQIVGPDHELPGPDAHTPATVTMHVDWVRLYR
jgi:glycosyl hydrolase family 16